VRKLESSDGIVALLLMMMMCSREGRTGEGDSSDNEGTRCLMRGICERWFSFGVVINNFVSRVSPILKSELTNFLQSKFKFLFLVSRIDHCQYCSNLSSGKERLKMR